MKNKKLQKKLMTAVSSAFLLSAAAAPITAGHVAAASNFKDVPAGAFYEKAVNNLSEKGVIGGYSDGTFKPGKSVTRAEAAKMLAFDLGLAKPTATSSNFTDVKKNDWFYEPVTSLAQAGGISGFQNGTFQPNKTITRAEMASMLVKAFSLEENAEASKAQFTDVNPNSWYASAVQTLFGNKITSGKSATKFAPNDPVTRGEIAAFIQKVNDAKGNASTGTTVNNENKNTSIIEKISDDSTTITISGQSYKIPATLNGILNSSNSAILAKATMKFEVKDGQISKITYLQLNTSGQPSDANKEFSNNLSLDGKGNTINGTLEVNADYISLKNITITGNLEITSKLANDFYSEKLTIQGQTLVNGGDSNTVVFKDSKLATATINKKDVKVEAKGNTSIQALNINSNAHVAADDSASLSKTTINSGASTVQLDGPFRTVEANQAATLKGNAEIKDLQVKQNANLSLELKNKIAQITAEKGGKFSLDADTAIGQLLLPLGVQASDVVSNFNDRKNNIEKTNNEVNADYKAPSASAGGGGGGATTTKPTADSILSTYKTQLEQLKSEAQTKFEALKTEVKQSANYQKDGTIDFSYMAKALQLYDHYESEFNKTYTNAKSNLVKNGYSEGDADPIKNEFDRIVGEYGEYLN